MTEFEAMAGLGVPAETSKDRADVALLKLAGTLERLQAAAGKTDTSPTEAQKESGRYRKGRFAWKGLTLAIETAAGQKRRPEWPALKDHYGYVEGTESGADGDAVDVFVSEDHPDSELVFVVNQKKPDGSFDEHKCVLGVHDLAAAKDTYLRNYSPGWTGMGEVTAITLDHFKWWLKNADTSKEVKNGYFAAPANRKPEKRGADNPTSGEKPTETEAEFWKRNEASKERTKNHTLGHIRDGYIPCGGCQYRYHEMPLDEKCPKCGHTLGVRLRSVRRPLTKSAFDNPPRLVLVKRAEDDESDRPFALCVDLDGTLAEKEEPFDADSIGDPIARAVEWVRLFHAAGARIIIFTVRGDRKQVREWLDANDVPYDYVNENPDQPEGTSGKILADAYWDDRAFNAEDPDEHGPTILRKILARGGETEDTSEDSAGPTITIRRETVVTISGPAVLEALEDITDGQQGDAGTDEKTDRDAA